MTILRSTKQIPDAETADLLETYNAMTGETVKRFSNRAVAERRCEHALMVGTERSAHHGVPKGTDPVPMTVAEAEAKDRGKASPAPQDGHRSDPPAAGGHPPQAEETNPFKPGTMTHQLWVASRAAPKVEPRPRKQKADGPPKQPVSAVRATFAGTSVPQSGSIRNNVLLFIQNSPEHTATVEAVTAHIQADCRGYIQKLIEKQHLTVVAPEAKN